MSEPGDDVALMDGELLLRKLHPHPLAFFDMYLVWVWVALLSLVFMIWGPQITAPLAGSLFTASDVASEAASAGAKAFDKLPAVGDALTRASAASSTARDSATLTVWLAAIILSAVAISVLRIEWKWIILMACVGLVSAGTTVYMGLSPKATYQIAMLLSILGIVFVDMFRSAHAFYVTDRRIITEVRFGGLRRNELSYDKIHNLVLEQGLIGSLFNFGTIIPVTASGLGMGSDFSAVSVGSQGKLAGLPVSAQVTGGRSVQIPRVRSMYGLWGVCDPEGVQKLISERMHGSEEAPYLKKMTEQLSDISAAVADKK